MRTLFTMLFFVTLTISGCRMQRAYATGEIGSGRQSSQVPLDDGISRSISAAVNDFTVRTGIVDGRMAFIGQGGVIDGIVNPDLVVEVGTIARVTVINGDGMSHDLSIPALGVKTQFVSRKGAAAELNLMMSDAQEGSYTYFCSVSGHRQAGMEGMLIVQPEAQNTTAASN